ncbi:MAG: hypothetical protein IJS04_03350 [Muribaculaceae bacterium]|nr:hypothetical protein [Muribaculaceae bacterium]MBQ7204860.1 hypothetical protein [Muribaculaceae bacterium]
MRNRPTLSRQLLLLAEAIAFAVLAVVAVNHFGFTDGLKISMAYLVAYLVPRITLARARGTSTAACVVLLVLAAVLMSIDYVRLERWTFFDEFSLELPNLGGDGRSYYKWALSRYDGSVESGSVVFPGFPLMMLGLWKVLGVNVVWPQALNLMFSLMTVVLTGLTTRRLLAHRVSQSPRTLLLSGMLLACLLIYLLMLGTSILKEGSICFAVALAGFVLASFAAEDQERHRWWRDIVLFVLASLLIALVRTTYLYFIVVGVVIMALPKWRRDWTAALVMLAVLGVSLAQGNYFSSYSVNRHAEIATGGWNMQRFYVMSESQQFYHDLLNYYFLYSPWHKLLMLPLTMSVQFIIPFPWVYYENQSFLNLLSRMTYGWYFIGGTSLFYYFWVSWRRNGNMGVWPCWPAVSFAVIAYVMAGSVARYVTPIEPLFVPVAVYVLCRLFEGRWRRPYLIWMIVFIVIVALALLVCLEIQQGVISKMLHTQSLVQYLRTR